MPLHIDFRPSTLEEVYGNNSIKVSLETIFARKDRPHAYLFHGPSGCGKTTLGRIVANMLGASPDDIHEYDAAKVGKKETALEISENCRYAPMSGKVKVYIVEEVHGGSDAFKDALLKLLEEPPSHVYCVLCTTEPDKLLVTIHNRCTSYQVKPLLNVIMNQLLTDILVSEGIADFPEKVLNEIIRVSEGCARQALVILDQVIDITDEEAALEAIIAFTGEHAAIVDICKLLMDKKDSKKWAQIRKMIKTLEAEPEQVRRTILKWMAGVLLNNDSNDRIAEILGCFTDSWYYSGRGSMVQALYFASKL